MKYTLVKLLAQDPSGAPIELAADENGRLQIEVLENVLVSGIGAVTISGQPVDVRVTNTPSVTISGTPEITLTGQPVSVTGIAGGVKFTATLTQYTTDLPASASSPLEINPENALKLTVGVDVESRYCWAANLTDASTEFGAGNVGKLLPGAWEIDAYTANRLYVRNAANEMVTNGVWYDLIGQGA